MKKMASSNVLVVGVQGLGAEVGEYMRITFATRHSDVHFSLSAKDVVLAGVKSVTIYDPEPVTIQDLSSQVCQFLSQLYIYLQ